MAGITQGERNKAANFGYPSALGRSGPPIGGKGGGKKGQNKWAWAQSQADRLINAQVKAIEDQKNAYLLQLYDQQNAQIQRARALSQELANMGFGGKIMTQFGQMGASNRDLTQGMANSVRSEANASAADQANQLSGTGQEGDVRNQGDVMGSVMNQQFGIIPGNTLEQMGQAWGADANRQPGFEAAQGFQDAMMNYKPDLAEFFSQIADIKSQRPGMVQDLLSQRAKARYDAQKLQWAQQDRRQKLADAAYKRKMDNLERERDWFLDQARLAQSQGRMDVSYQYLALAQQREARMAQNQAFNQNYKNQHPPGSSSKKGPDWGDIQKDVANDISDLTKTIPDPNSYKPGATIDVPMSYDEAFQVLMSRYSGMVKDQRRLKALIRKVLIRNGIKPRNKYDRSLDPNGPENPGR